ncbi:MAG: (2Fe-2S) ferredoxin domain-containing protein [Clostridiaceae bacterium]|jgi:NADP-reducing hydrogenase subunit HndB|nr:(2Fe-2S) ferredoxin domain-containing protein [Clostridiaceae bacterium]
MKTIEEIYQIREKTRKKLGVDAPASETRIVVGLATCGVASGAKPVYDAFKKAIKENKIKKVTVGQAGCIGMCKFEPLVQVFVPGQPVVTYVNIGADAVSQIIEEHILGGKPVAKYTITQE